MSESEELLKFHEAGQLIFKVENAIRENNLETVKDILNSECYKRLTKQEKEEKVFYELYIESFNSNNADHFLRYIIFDYKISEETSIHTIPDLNDKIRNMFEARKLNEELRTELEVNNDKSTKKPKV